MLQPIMSYAAADDSKQAFIAVSDAYLDEVFFPYQPTTGTLTGYHQFDTKLEDLSRQSIKEQIAALHSYDKRVTAISARD